MFGLGVSPLNVADMELSVPSAADPELPASTGTRNSESAAFAVCNSGSAALGEGDATGNSKSAALASIAPYPPRPLSITPFLQRRAPER